MINAIGDKIIVAVLKREKTSGGIVLPSNTQEPQSYGKVISKGEQVYNVEVNDYLIFHNRAGMDIMFDKQILKVVKYDEIYGIIKDENLINQLEVKEIVK